MCDRIHRCYLTGLSGALAENWPTALNSSMDLEAYIYATPGYLKIARVPRHHKHTQEYLQAIQVFIDHIFSP